MIQTDNVIDILLVENHPLMKMVFEELSKIFNLTIVIAENIEEFIEMDTLFQFRFILCDIHIENNFAGLLVSRMHNKIKKANPDDEIIFFFSLQHNENVELAKLVLDDLSEERFKSFYEFLEAKFPVQFFQYFSSDEFKQEVHA